LDLEFIYGGVLNMKKCYLYLLLFGIVVSGCATQSNFTALSSKNVNLSNIQIDRAKSKGRSSGEDCMHIIILFPTGGPPTLDEALDNALEPKRANILLDAIVEHNFFYIPYIYGQECWKVKGEAYDSYE